MRLITGPARSGKTAAILGEIRDAVTRREGRSLLIVPEQYSHEAERELCEACGDSLSLYAEVMSFTGLARWMQSRFGGGSRLRISQGGKLLCVTKSLKELKPMLRRYAPAAEHPDQQLLFLQELDMLRSSGTDSARLREIAEDMEPALAEKLTELAAVQEGCDAVMARARLCTQDLTAQLAEQIGLHGLPGVQQVYVDGFIDFTGLELQVLEAMIRRKVPLTVCLTLSENTAGDEHMLPSLLTRQQLTALAAEADQPVTEIHASRRETEMGALRFFSDNMFRFDADHFPLRKDEVRLLATENPRAECEAAAELILRAVREQGCRWRDIAVAVRGFDDYRLLLQTCFRQYGIPTFETRRDSLTDRSFPIWIECAYDVILDGWDTEDMTAYLRCGMSGLDDDACDELCAYLRRWKLKAADWKRTGEWMQHPEGYGMPMTPADRRRLRRINRYRRRVSEPLLCFEEDAAAANDGAGQARAVAAFLINTRAAAVLEARARRLDRDGLKELRAEYLQLWELCTAALGQVSAILGDTAMDAREFRELLHAVLARTDIGLIPVSLDRVAVGDFDRMRRRNIRRLIVLGCSDERLPQARAEKGIFSAEERDLLAEHRLVIGGGEGELWREYALIYHTLSLPSEQLVLSCPALNGAGERCMPAFVWQQVQKIFSLKPEHPNLRRSRLAAESPAFGLALQAEAPGAREEERAAAQWFRESRPEHFERILAAVRTGRGSLSPQAVEALYGRRLHVSPSRLEQFSACRFAYYCRYGLKAKEEKSAEYSAPEIGSFIHRVLEGVAREVRELGGFREVTDEQLRTMAERHIARYVREELGDFAEKSARFRHLFRRLCGDVLRIVTDSAEELRRSDFVPLRFELDISGLSQELPLTEGSLTVNGIADRVDGWIHDGIIDLRVVDYKTGKKEFKLADVLYGRDLQMLLYLFAVCDDSEELFGLPGRSAGIVYLPARETRPEFEAPPEPEDAEAEKRKAKRRSGLVLNDRDLLQAWEHGEDSVYIPIRTRSADPLVSLEQLGLLRRSAEATLTEMGEELLHGSISADPLYRDARNNACLRCEFGSVCRFREGENGESSRPMAELKDEEVWELLRRRAEEGDADPARAGTAEITDGKEAAQQ